MDRLPGQLIRSPLEAGSYPLHLLLETDTKIEHAFLDTTSFESARALDKLPGFLKAFSTNEGSRLSKSAEEKGTPHTLVVAPAGLRAADLVR
jgi:U3-containing 90S pre-ribosomal complex subunit